MDFVREEIENLKKLGYSWDMQQSQIEEAILKAIADKNGNTPTVYPDETKRTRPSKGNCYNCLKACGLMTFAVIMIAATGIAMFNNYPPFELYVNKAVGDMSYPVLRVWRRMTLPLHRFVDLTSISVADCLIDNPWYTIDEPDCSACEEARDVPLEENITNFSEDYAPWGNPIIVTDVKPYMAKNYTVDSFFQYYEDYKDLLNNDLCEVSSLDESVNTIEDYYDILQKLGPEAPNIRWKVCYGEGLRALRKFLPRPYFVKTEGALEKFLMIINSNKEVFPLPSGQYANSWIAQVTGASHMKLNAIPQCNQTCTNLEVTLQKGEVMFVNVDFWNVDIHGNPSDEVGIVLLSTFA